jgi:protein O-GlcNAc transferase
MAKGAYALPPRLRCPCDRERTGRDWNTQHAQPLQSTIVHENDRTPDRRLRIGYVSPDFRAHAHPLCLIPLLRAHDRQQFEVYCYTDATAADPITEQPRSLPDRWIDTRQQSDESVAAQIRADRIDILVDLAMHLPANRLLLFARKPAPVQASCLAYPGSTGVAAMDYRLSDPHLDPPGMDESVYSEKTIRLPQTFRCYDPLTFQDIPVGSLPAQERGTITFGCLNHPRKISDAILHQWSRVMAEVGTARLLLLAPNRGDQQRIVDRLTKDGIHPSRIEMLADRPRREYLRLYHQIDITLDTFPYAGDTTSLDSLWMGVPIITLIGQTAVSRAGLSLLSNLNLSELAAEAPDEFVRIAIDLANDLPRLQSLRSTLRQRMQQSPLMDATIFARSIEAAYRRMWHNWCDAASA